MARSMGMRRMQALQLLRNGLTVIDSIPDDVYSKGRVQVGQTLGTYFKESLEYFDSFRSLFPDDASVPFVDYTRSLDDKLSTDKKAALKFGYDLLWKYVPLNVNEKIRGMNLEKREGSPVRVKGSFPRQNDIQATSSLGREAMYMLDEVDTRYNKMETILLNKHFEEGLAFKGFMTDYRL